MIVTALQLGFIATLLLLWEYLPQIGNLAESSHYLDPFFISSPSRIADRLTQLATGSEGSVRIWPYLWPTIEASLLGTAIGTAMGALSGLVFSNFRLLSDVLTPFVVALNAVPRIAMIPVLVILFGITFTTSVAASILIVFFVVFFNAYEGGRTVPLHLLQNARLLGASEWHVMRNIRLPFVLAWTLASAPLALTFSLLAVVTTEILTGYAGLGQLLGTATSTADSSLTFSVVVILSVLGVAAVGLLELIKRRVLHWWVAH